MNYYAQPRRFADGGLADLAESYGVANPTGLPSIPMPEMPDMNAGPPQGMMPQAQPPMGQMGAPGAPQAPQQPADLASLYAKWQPQQNSYIAELRAAQERERAEQAAFNQLIEQSTSQKSEGPGQAEMYFRLAAAFGAPTRSGHFTESLGNAGKAMADIEQEKRQLAGGDKKSQMAARLELRKLGLQSAKDETATLRALAGQEAQSQRALASQEAQAQRQMALEIMKEKFKTGQPQSEAGKAAMDAGHTPGTPEYQSFVVKRLADLMEKDNVFKTIAAQNSSIMAGIAGQNAETARLRLGLEEQRMADQREKGKKLTPKELDLKIDTEDALNTFKGVESTLADALKLNPQTFDTSLGDSMQRKLLENTQSNHPKVLATRRQENMLAEQAVSGLKASFGGNPTEGERKILLDLQGIGAKSKEERADIIKRAQAAAERRRKAAEKRLGLINAGQYRDTGADAGTAAPTE